MSVSGILLIAAPAQGVAVCRALVALPWAEVHQQDDAGRMIVTVEAADSDQGLERLKALKALPGVLSAELVIHCFEDERAEPPRPAAAMDALNGEAAGLPRRSYLSRLEAQGNY